MLAEIRSAHFDRLIAAWRERCIKAGFNPDQPRAPAGSPDGGQWTSGEGGGGAAAAGDGRVRLAASSSILSRRQSIAVRFPEATPAQQARLLVAEVRADMALRDVREIDPHWRREPSLVRTIEGQIEAEAGAANAARARLNDFGQLGISREAMRPDDIGRFTANIVESTGVRVSERTPGARPNIATLDRPGWELMRDDLLTSARPIPTRASYRGLWFERFDGVRFGLRISERHGPTIDLMTRDHPAFRQNLNVHQR